MVRHGCYGLFDVKGLTASEPSLQIVSPLFDNMTVRLNRDYFPGKEFVIKTNGNSIDNIHIYMYVSRARLNGGGTALTAIAMGFSCRRRIA